MLDVIRTSSQSWWVRGIFLLLIATFLLWGVASALFPNTTTVATVNGYPITQDQFLRRLQQEKQSILQENSNLSEQMLESMGIRTQVLQNLILRHLLLSEAQNIGLFISKEALQKEIMNLPLFKNKEGKFDLAMYKTILENNKRGVLIFEQDMKEDLLIQELIQSVRSSSFVDTTTARQMYNFLNEERSIDYILIPATKYINTVQVTAKEKEDFYNKNKNIWEQPHRLRIAYIPLTTSAIMESFEIPESTINEYYNNHKEQYNTIPRKEANAQITKILKEQQIASKKEDLLDTIQMLSAQGRSLQQIAKQINIPLSQSELLPPNELEQRLNLSQNSLSQSIENTPSASLLPPLAIQNSPDFIIASLLENIPASTPSLQEIDADVDYAVRSEKALEQAKQYAQKLLDTGKLPSNTTRTPLFPRFNPPLELPIRSETFINDLFMTSAQHLLPHVYTTTQGALIARVHEVFPAPETDWKKEQKFFTQQIQNVQSELLFRAFQNYLYEKATIIINNEAILQPALPN